MRSDRPVRSAVRGSVAALLVLAGAVAGGGGCIPSMGFLIRPVPADQTVTETFVAGDRSAAGKVLVLDVDGMLADAEGGLIVKTENPVAFFLEKVKAAGEDDAVKAVVLRVDSPGGTVSASDTMYNALVRLREAKRKADPKFALVAMMMGTAASGGYYISMAADEVHAMPSTVTGSIGVIMMMPDVTGLMDKLGVRMRALKSGPSKDSGSPFRAMSPEEERYFKDELIARFYRQFVDVVAKNRTKLTRERITELADGRVYLGEAAAQNGLVDRTGTLEEAIDRAASLAGLDRKRVVLYHRPLGWKGTAYAETPVGPAGAATAGTTVNLLNIQLDAARFLRPGFWFLWQPGL